MQMRVGIDISAIQYNRGVSRYTSNLVRALYEHKHDVALKLFGASFRQRAVLQTFAKKTCPTALSRILPHPARIMDIVWNQFHVFSPERLLGKIDVFHSWEVQPPLQHAALVSTIHDLAMLRFPKTTDPTVLAMNERSWKYLKKEAKAVIAVSEVTKKDIIELLQIDPSKVFVVHEALTEESQQKVSVERKKELLAFFGLIKPYFLFVGTIEPRKNLKRLIQAWQPMKKEYDLVIAGAAGWENITQEDGLRIVGTVTNEELVALYAGAELLAYPSLYEGFGLPILDAFYHGIPVVTSNVSSMPELAGDAAVLVNPHEVESITIGLKRALEKKSYFTEKGKQRLQQFSWEKAAKQTIEVYRKASDAHRN